MFNVMGTTDSIRVVTQSVAQIEVHASWADTDGTAVSLGRQNTAHITTATTTMVVPAPAAGFARNVKHLNITNDHASASCTVTVEHTDGTTIIEMMAFTLLSGENMIFNEEGRWAHRDAQGAEYPPAGKGAYDGYPSPILKIGTAPDALGYWYCTAKDAGFPGAWSAGTPGVNGRNTDGTVAADFGCMPIKTPSIGANYITELMMGSSIAHYNVYFDVLWVNTGLVITQTTAQAIAMTGPLPPRDINGTTNGEGCMIALLCTSAIGLAAVNALATVGYTNSDGVAGRTATLSAMIGSQAPATPVIGTFILFNLQAGDRGVRSIQSFNFGATSWVSGSVSLMITRDLSSIGQGLPYIPMTRSIKDPGIRLFNGTCALHAYLSSAATATLTNGELTIQEK